MRRGASLTFNCSIPRASTYEVINKCHFMNEMNKQLQLEMLDLGLWLASISPMDGYAIIPTRAHSGNYTHSTNCEGRETKFSA